MAIVDELLDMGFCMVGGVPCIPTNDSKFAFGLENIYRAMIDVDRNCTRANRKEAYETLELLAVDYPLAQPQYIAFENCVVDVINDERMTMDEFIKLDCGIIPVTIPHDFNPDAPKNELIETLLDGIACNKSDVRMNLEELAGLCMSRFTGDRNAIAWLYGNGANGKSTFRSVLSSMLGPENCSYLMLGEIGGQYNKQILANKLMNFSDDEESKTVDKKTLGDIKRIVTGEPMKAEQKMEPIFFFTPFCTPIVTSNEPPVLAETTIGISRRFHCIPLDADFQKDSSTQPDMDLASNISKDEDALRYFISLAYGGLRRVLENGGMTKTEYSKLALDDMMRRSNSVIDFLATHTREELLEENNVELWYWRYFEWVKDEGSHPFKPKQFTYHVNAKYGFTTENNGYYSYTNPVPQIVKIHDKTARIGGNYRQFFPK